MNAYSIDTGIFRKYIYTMELKNRQVDSYIFDKELTEKKMIFISGPRQIGKTTYASHLLNSRYAGVYCNWDNPLIRRKYNEDPFFFLKEYAGGTYLVIFDEIHKRIKWKDILKGIYDSIEPQIQLLVTGSARLEWFRKSGDSLVGRYAHFHMLPVSLSEGMGIPLKRLWLCSADDLSRPMPSLFEKIEGNKKSAEQQEILEHLFYFGGFPEPFTRSSERFLRKWKQDYISLLLTEDMRELSNIRAIDRMEQLIDLLPERIGSPLSINSLAQDIDSNYHTVKNSITQLEKLWLLFSVRPWSKRLNRTIKKEVKSYFTNWIYAGNEGAKFENLIATHLFRAVTLWTDCGYGTAQLWYIRNFDGGEIDFLITLDGKPLLLIESKLSKVETSKPAVNFCYKMNIPLLQVVYGPGIFKKVDKDIYIISAAKFLSVIP